ncbi:MAG: diguanylate cyclase [Ruminococcus sp.]|nr:diguanylate cyclase [Ruminococcus sp.]
MSSKSSIKMSVGYKIAMVIAPIFFILSGFVTNFVYKNGKNLYDTNFKSVEYINSINNDINKISSYLAQMATELGVNNRQADMSKKDDILAYAYSEFDNINRAMNSYQKINNLTDLEKRRFNQCRLGIIEYQDKLAYMDKMTSQMTLQELTSVYMQEMKPIQVRTSEMLEAAIDLSSDVAQDSYDQNNRLHNYINYGLISAAVIVELALIVIALKSVKAKKKIAEKNFQLERAGEKLKNSHQKIVDIANINILTDMHNRYALEQDLDAAIGKESFSIGVLDIDNFRSVNDSFGYGVGDEYLAAVAEKLNKEYSNSAKLYNISGNEFCFIFNKDITELQARQMLDLARENASNSFVVSEAVVQCPVSGSFYRYYPEDNLNVNTLLMKLDNALRAAKNSGGNRIQYISNL